MKNYATKAFQKTYGLFILMKCRGMFRTMSTSKMERFAKNYYRPKVSIFAKHFILNV